MAIRPVKMFRPLIQGRAAGQKSYILDESARSRVDFRPPRCAGPVLRVLDSCHFLASRSVLVFVSRAGSLANSFRKD
jgi:hypothetical protein